MVPAQNIECTKVTDVQVTLYEMILHPCLATFRSYSHLSSLQLSSVSLFAFFHRWERALAHPSRLCCMLALLTRIIPRRWPGWLAGWLAAESNQVCYRSLSLAINVPHPLAVSFAALPRPSFATRETTFASKPQSHLGLPALRPRSHALARSSLLSTHLLHLFSSQARGT